jgi:hypothetical protein
MQAYSNDKVHPIKVFKHRSDKQKSFRYSYRMVTNPTNYNCEVDFIRDEYRTMDEILERCLWAGWRLGDAEPVANYDGCILVHKIENIGGTDLEPKLVARFYFTVEYDANRKI